MKNIYKNSSNKKLQSIKKFLHNHFPTFIYAWHSKIDVHVFRYTFVGLLLIVVFVIISSLMVSLNSTTSRTTSTQASDANVGVVYVEEERVNDQRQEWKIKIEGKNKLPADKYIWGIYVSFCNSKDSSAFRFTQSDQYMTKNNYTIDLVELSSQPETVVARSTTNNIFIKGSDWVTPVTLFGAESAMEQPRIKKAYLYLIDLSDKRNKVEDISEYALAIRGGSCATASPTLRPQPNSPVLVSGAPTSGVPIDSQEARDRFCQNTMESRSKPLLNKFRGCYAEGGVNIAVCGEKSAQECTSNCGLEDYIVNPPPGMCEEVTTGSGGGSTPTTPSQQTSSPSTYVSCYTNQFCNSIGAGSCQGGSCKRGQQGKCTATPEQPQSGEQAPNQWCSQSRFGSEGSGNSGGSRSGQEGQPSSATTSQNSAGVTIQKQDCPAGISRYFDNTTFSGRACVCSDDFLTVPDSFCQEN